MVFGLFSKLAKPIGEPGKAESGKRKEVIWKEAKSA